MFNCLINLLSPILLITLIAPNDCLNLLLTQPCDLRNQLDPHSCSIRIYHYLFKPLPLRQVNRAFLYIHPIFLAMLQLQLFLREVGLIGYFKCML